MGNGAALHLKTLLRKHTSDTRSPAIYAFGNLATPARQECVKGGERFSLFAAGSLRVCSWCLFRHFFRTFSPPTLTADPASLCFVQLSVDCVCAASASQRRRTVGSAEHHTQLRSQHFKRPYKIRTRHSRLCSTRLAWHTEPISTPPNPPTFKALKKPLALANPGPGLRLHCRGGCQLGAAPGVMRVYLQGCLGVRRFSCVALKELN